MPPPAATRPTEVPWDPSAKWVRIVGERANGMVEFEFAVGEPELFVELLLPRTQFDDFCAMHAVTPTHDALEPTPAGSERHEWDWTLKEASARHFRHEPDG